MKGHAIITPRIGIQKNQGFTLIEMLAVIIVLTLMTAVVATGVSTSVSIYTKNQFASQTDVLSGTIDNSLADSFRFLTGSGTDSDPWALIYRSNGTDIKSPSLSVSDGQLYITGTVDSTSSSSSTKVPVLNSGAYGNCEVSLGDNALTITSQKAEDNTTYAIITLEYTITDKTDSSLTKTHTVTYRSNGASITKVS
jgi:prepilin-type N-terminal cleavage/methylation domain-containing protein